MGALRTDRYVAEVEGRLSAFVAAGHSGGAGLLAVPGGHLVLAGGKRLRPRLVELFGDTCGVAPAALVDLGAVAELLHSASLLYDDVSTKASSAASSRPAGSACRPGGSSSTALSTGPRKRSRWSY